MSEKKKFSDYDFTGHETTFYGFDQTGSWFLNGETHYHSEVNSNNNGESIEKNFNGRSFKDVVLDFYFDADNDGGIFKIKVVKSEHHRDEGKEAIISNINNCADNHKKEWIPHFIFGSYTDNQQRAMFASIPVSWYGIDKPIQWNV